MSRDWRGARQHWLPVQHRQAIALLADLRARLKLMETTSGQDTVNLERIVRHHLDAVLQIIMLDGDHVRHQQEAASASTFWCATCDDCTEASGGERLVMTFQTPEEQERWCDAHREGTGHDNWGRIKG